MKPYTSVLAGKLFVGPIVALAAGAATLTVEMDDSYRHSFAAVEFYSDDAGTHVVTTAGAITFTLTSPLLPNKALEFVGNQVATNNEETVSWAANVTAVTAVVTAVTGATHCRLRAIGNVS